LVGIGWSRRRGKASFTVYRRTAMRMILGALAVVAVGALGMSLYGADKEDAKKEDTRVFELRVYHAAPGKMKALHARFRDHTNKLFKKHGMTIIAFWTPTDSREAEKQLIYILAYPSRKAADKSWKDFRSDPDWLKAKEESEKDGRLVDKFGSTYMKPTDYSPIK
jgi:hypothetical protein